MPANAREVRVFVAFPDPYKPWAAQHGYLPPPTERCDDIYKGVRRAEFAGPSPGAPIRGTVQIVGTALMDDLHHYDLEVGEGPNPARWSGITIGRQQGVDNALLGVWDTAALKPGPYTLRLSLFDSLGNKQEARAQLTVAAVQTPTPQPTSGTPQPTPAGTPRGTPGPGGTPASGTPTPARGTAAPAPTPARR